MRIMYIMLTTRWTQQLSDDYCRANEIPVTPSEIPVTPNYC
jgi:hypothetical protein